MTAHRFPMQVTGGTWKDRYTFQPDGSTSLYFSERGIANNTALPYQTGKTVRGKSVDRRLGKAIDKKRVPAPFHPKGRAWVYSAKHISKMDKAQSTKHADYQARTPGYLTRNQLTANYKVSLGFEPYWTNRPSRLRKDGKPALRYDWEYHAVGGHGGSTKIKIFCEEDIGNILAGKESTRYGTGRPANANLRAPTIRAGDVAWLRGYLLDHGPTLSSLVTREARKAGIGAYRLMMAWRTAKAQTRRQFGPPGGSPVYWYLKGQSVPAVIDRRASHDNGRAHPAPSAASYQRKDDPRPLAEVNAHPVKFHEPQPVYLVNHPKTEPVCPVQVVGQNVFVNGKPVELNVTSDRREDALKFLLKLSGSPGCWFSTKEIDPLLTRVDRCLMPFFPAELSSLIESNTKKGFRISALDKP